MAKVFLVDWKDLEEGRSRALTVDGKDLVVCNIGGEPKAYRNFCPHMGGKVRMQGEELVCNMHNAKFEAGTGCGIAGIAIGSKLEVYDVVVEDGKVYANFTEEKSPWADDF